MPRTILHRRWRAPAAMLFWTCIGLVFALPMLGHRADWRTPVLASLIQWWAWGLLTPLIVALDRRLPFNSAQMLWRVGAHVGLGVLAAALHVLLQALLAALLGTMAWRRLADVAALDGADSGSVLWSMPVYFLILGAWWAYQAHGKQLAAELSMERMERNHTEARLHALRQQLDPHFLFNALNTISAQVQAEPKLARQMIEHLGDLLRLSLDPKSRGEVALADELAFLDLYLAIQHIRFGDKLRVTRDIGADVLLAAVPSLFLQPLVENAIRHGMSHRASGGTIAIKAARVGGVLDITVRDDGAGLAPERPGTAGLGLRLTRERLAGFHPAGATRLTIGNHPDGGVVVALRLPLRLMENAHAAA